MEFEGGFGIFSWYMDTSFLHEDNLIEGPIFAAINWAPILGVFKEERGGR